MIKKFRINSRFFLTQGSIYIPSHGKIFIMSKQGRETNKIHIFVSGCASKIPFFSSQSWYLAKVVLDFHDLTLKYKKNSLGADDPKTIYISKFKK